jgi:hypothetical protein
MTDKQNAKLNMAQRVSDTLASHSGTYSKISPMVLAATELSANIADIREAETAQDSVSISLSTSEKRDAEGQMVDLCVKASNALYVIGFSTGNKSLLELSGLSPASFYRLEDNAKLSLANRVYAHAITQVAALADYGYDAAALEDIHTAIEQYQSLIARPMDMINLRKQKTTDLKHLFAKLDSILYDRLDKLIVLFKDSNPDFYGQYRTARNFIDTSVRHKKKN